MSSTKPLTRRQQFWLEHIHACGKGPLKAYADKHGLEVGALYEAKSRLKRKGVLPEPGPRFVRVTAQGAAEPAPALLRIHLRNATVVEMACAPEHWPGLLERVAALP